MTDRSGAAGDDGPSSVAQRRPRLGRFVSVLAPACVITTMLWAHGFVGGAQAWPLALHAAIGAPHARGVNLLGFVLPGLLWALSAWRLRQALGNARALSLRLATQALLLASLAWAGQGLWPLDTMDLDGPAAQRHALVWTLWWLAAAVAGLGFAAGLWRAGRPTATFVAAGLVAWLLLAVHATPALLSPAVAEMLALAAWSVGVWLAWRAPVQP